MRRQHNIPTFTSIIANRHSAAVWARIARTTPATAPRAILVTTEVLNNGIRRAGAQEIMSPMGRPFNPRSTAAKITRATVATSWVAAGRHIVRRRHNVLRRAGTKGIAGTRARRQGGVARGHQGQAPGRGHAAPSTPGIIPAVLSAAVCCTIRAGGTSIPRTPATVAAVNIPSNVVSAVSTTTTRGSSRPEPVAAAIQGAMVLRQRSIPADKFVTVNRHSAVDPLDPFLVACAFPKKVWKITVK